MNRYCSAPVVVVGVLATYAAVAAGAYAFTAYLIDRWR